MIQRIFPFGDRVLLVEWEVRIDPEINAQVHKLTADLRVAKLEGVLELIPAYCSLAVRYDPSRVQYSNLRDWIRHWTPHQYIRDAPERIFLIPVLYGGNAGPDLAEVSQLTGIAAEEIVYQHTATTYRTYLIGFLPGFPYLGRLPASIQVARKTQPRPMVPAGSIGLAGGQTGIYPTNAPGGWQLIGRTPVPIFAPQSENPFLLRPGDQVRFFPIEASEWNAWESRAQQDRPSLWQELVQKAPSS